MLIMRCLLHPLPKLLPLMGAVQTITQGQGSSDHSGYSRTIDTQSHGVMERGLLCLHFVSGKFFREHLHARPICSFDVRVSELVSVAD